MPGKTRLAATVAAFFMVAVTVTVIANLIGAAGARADDRKAGFTGLWQGVDNVDGSLRTLSFADLDGDGTYEVRGHDTFWTLCEGPGGLEDTTGKIEDGELHTKGTLVCANGKKVPMETKYIPHGPVADGMVVEHVEGKPFRTLLFRMSR